MEQQSWLSDIEFNPVLASTGKRFLNYFIDMIFFYILFIFISVTVAFPGGKLRTSSTALSDLQLFIQLFAFVFFLAYYFLCELIFKGRTIGKFITGTKAVNEDGTSPSAKTYLLRSLSRIVPFEPFSAFGSRPWHDRWTKTYVIDMKKTAFTNPAFQ